MSQALAKALARLLEVHPASVAASIMTIAQRKQLDEFARRTQSILVSTKGRGAIYAIRDVDVIELKVRQLVPSYGEQLSAPQRAANIAATRSSKTGRVTHDVTHILLKTRGNPCWYRADKRTEQLHKANEEFGVAALEIGGDKNCALFSQQPIWLVENQELFDQLDWLPSAEKTTVIWYRGQLHNKLIDWLSVPERASMVYFFADYDGVGLNNYRRLKERLGKRTEFWMMLNWRELLTRYGQNQLWLDTSREFESFERNIGPWFEQESELQELVKAMKKQGLALEQEVVWLDR
ncbi:DUF7281 domain-containing protein [Photobacterium nomapromontoriensis]|uniref:DUF7281 domain-containing protein n=1 Tax=Photobacterium nomapromontoriensis TaxID=2910237 RepID=UPI003D095BE4